MSDAHQERDEVLAILETILRWRAKPPPRTPWPPVEIPGHLRLLVSEGLVEIIGVLSMLPFQHLPENERGLERQRLLTAIMRLVRETETTDRDDEVVADLEWRLANDEPPEP